MSYLHSYETLAREIYTKLKTIKGRLSFDEITKILTPINNVKLSIYILKCSRKKRGNLHMQIIVHGIQTGKGNKFGYRNFAGNSVSLTKL